MAGLMLALTAVVVIWYLYFLRYNRAYARRSLDWLSEVLKGHGSIAKVHGANPALFRADLQVCSPIFHQAQVRLQLHPRHHPFSWLWYRWKKCPEILEFAADLHCRPGIELEVHNHRWSGGTPVSRGNELLAEFQHFGPFVLTTRTDWEREITSMLTALVASRDCNFLWVRFSRNSPHLVAAIPLQALAPGCSSASEFFVVLHELASCGSTSRF